MPLPIWQYLRPQKYRALLIVIVAALAVQPLAYASTAGKLAHEALVALSIFTLLAVFDRPIERWIALALAAPAVLAHWIDQLTAVDFHPVLMATFHIGTVVFLGFAIVTILKTLFRQRVVVADHLVGVFCGYLLAGLAWSNLYIVIHDLSPQSDAFNVSDKLVWETSNFDARRSLFNYFSFTTLTTVGYGDVTPIHPIACTLAWLEGAFGQFYVAVLVALLVGLKLAEPREAPDE